VTQSASIPAVELPPQPISYEDFLAWGLREDVSAEWVDGRIELTSPDSRTHQRVGTFLIALLVAYLERTGLGELLYDRFQMKTGPGLPGREPDFLVVLGENQHRLHETFLDGPADFVVEIVSDESRERDRRRKFREYERGGVREYWIIDPAAETADFYVRGAAGFELAHRGGSGVYRSSVVDGFWIDVRWLWDRPLLEALDALGMR
jgi:Uma2 family endonuclease